jgi:trigger factor
LKHQAKIHIQRALMIREIFTREQMRLTNEELNEELKRMAAEFGIHPMELVDILQKNGQMEELSFRALSRKVTDFLAAHAEVSVLAPGSAPAAPDQPAKEKPARTRAPKEKAE